MFLSAAHIEALSRRFTDVASLRGRGESAAGELLTALETVGADAALAALPPPRPLPLGELAAAAGPARSLAALAFVALLDAFATRSPAPMTRDERRELAFLALYGLVAVEVLT